MWRMFGAVVAVTAMVSGCASPETRLRTGLIHAGLGQKQAACMADRMVDRLSVLQLKRLGSLASLRDKNANDLTVDQFLYHVRALKDPEILTVSISSAAVCSVS